MASTIKPSSWSTRFDIRVRSIALPETVMNEANADWSRLNEFAPHTAIVCPDFATGRLSIQRAGDEICRNFGRSLAGTDYLDAVAPSMRPATIDATRSILDQPCGLWQVMTARTSGGQSVALEYTIYPLKDVSGVCSKMIAHLHIEDGNKPSSPIVEVQQALAWAWMDLGLGAPPTKLSKA